MKKITPFLWFDANAEEAMNHYLSVFKNSKAGNVTRAGGKVLTVSFQLEGQDFVALNGGPLFTFTEAISLFVNCETQDEVDLLWNKLCAGGGQPAERSPSRRSRPRRPAGARRQAAACGEDSVSEVT